MCQHLARDVGIPLYRGIMPMFGPDIDKVPDTRDEPEALLPVQERRRLWEFLHRFEGITQKQKHVIIRRLVDEAEFPEIARELGIARQPAERIYKRALKRIKKAWEQYG